MGVGNSKVKKKERVHCLTLLHIKGGDGHVAACCCFKKTLLKWRFTAVLKKTKILTKVVGRIGDFFNRDSRLGRVGYFFYRVSRVEKVADFFYRVSGFFFLLLSADRRVFPRLRCVSPEEQQRCYKEKKSANKFHQYLLEKTSNRIFRIFLSPNIS